MSSATSGTGRRSPCHASCGCSIDGGSGPPSSSRLRRRDRPDAIRSIRDAGHEIGHHGYMHESVRGKDEATEVGYPVRGLEALDSVAGVRPVGYRPPSCDMNFRTPDLVARHGFTYCSGMMDLIIRTAGRPGSSSCRCIGASTTGTATTTCRAMRLRPSCSRRRYATLGPRSSRRSSRSADCST